MSRDADGVTEVRPYAVRKVTVSVDDALLVEIEQLAEELGQSRNEAIAQALELALRQKKLQRVVARMLDEPGGPISRKKRAEARKSLGLPRRWAEEKKGPARPRSNSGLLRARTTPARPKGLQTQVDLGMNARKEMRI